MMSFNLKILFIGSVDFSLKTFSFLIKNNYNVVGVITKKTSTFNSDHVDLSIVAKNKNIPFIYRQKNNEKSIIDFIENCSPDVIYCFGWSHILSEKIVSSSKYGVIGFHPASLPKNRGRHPIVWALFLGLKYTASTFFFIDKNVDSGNIISQKKINISEKDDAQTLYSKIINTSFIQIKKITDNLIKNSGIINSQIQDSKKTNHWRKRLKKDGLIDFRMSSSAILNLIKALTHPYVGAHVEYDNNEIKIWKAKKVIFSEKNIEPGKVLNVLKNEIIVKTYDGAIKIVDHEFKTVPKIGDYL